MRVKRKINNYLIDLIVILETFFLALKYYFPIELVTYFHFSSIFIIFIIGFIYIPKLQLSQKINFYIILLFLSTFFFTVLIRQELQSWIVFMGSIICMIYFSTYGIDKRSLKTLLFMNILLSFIHFINYNGSNLFLQSEVIYGNTNMMGIILTSSILILVTGFFYTKQKYLKILYSISIFSNLIILISTANRGSFFTLLVLFLLLFFYVKRKKINKSLSVIFYSFPLFFVILYSTYIFIYFQDFTAFDKTVNSGRHIEWKFLLEKIINNPFSISDLPVGGLNIVISSIISFGFIGTLSYFLLMYNLKPNISKSKKFDYRFVSYLAFLCVFLQQSFEATLIQGNYGVYIFTYILLAISISNFDNNKKKLYNQ